MCSVWEAYAYINLIVYRTDIYTENVDYGEYPLQHLLKENQLQNCG